MTQRFDDDTSPRPLPRDWLPEAAAPEGTPEWETRAARIIAAAGPAIDRLANRDPRVEATLSTQLGSWWKPAVALAAAAAAMLFVLDQPQAIRESGRGALALGIVAADGEAAGLWQGLGIDADPVLALIALQQPDR
jgi:hypothetical protein